MRWILVCILATVILFAGALFIKLGAYRSVDLALQTKPPMRLLYKEHFGAYHKIVPVIEEVEKWAKAQGIDCRYSFGEYLDDPKAIDQDRLRSRGGCVVTDFPKEMPADFKTFEYPERKYVIAIFSGGPSIGPFKVYPKAMDFIKEQRTELNGPVIEVYEVKSPTEVTTTYHFPIK